MEHRVVLLAFDCELWAVGRWFTASHWLLVT